VQQFDLDSLEHIRSAGVARESPAQSVMARSKPWMVHWNPDPDVLPLPVRPRAMGLQHACRMGAAQARPWMVLARAQTDNCAGAWVPTAARLLLLKSGPRDRQAFEPVHRVRVSRAYENANLQLSHPGYRVSS